MFGGNLFGSLADKYGRRPIMILTILMYSVFSGMTYFATSLEQVMGLRFLVAMWIGGEWAVAAALFIFAFSGLVAKMLVFIKFSYNGTPVAVKSALVAPLKALPVAPETASLLFALLFNGAMFAIAWFMWKKKISLKGKIRGTIDDLVGKDLNVRAGNSTVLNGDISMTGLPDINETFIDFKANDFRTTYNDAVSIIPAMRRVTNPDLRKIQYVNFKGSFTGFIRDFVTFGTIQTNLGNLTTDLNMKMPKGKQPIYSGSIAPVGNFRHI